MPAVAVQESWTVRALERTVVLLLWRMRPLVPLVVRHTEEGF
jgi:hypothetical protein